MVTRESYTRRVVKDARAWFREHVIDISTMPDEASQNGLMTVVDFHRPDSSMYAVRYIYSGHYVFVSGDLGTAVFNCTWRTGPTDGYWKNTDYVYEKLDAAKHTASFDSDVCLTNLRNGLLEPDEKGNHNRFPSRWTATECETFRLLREEAERCVSVDQWHMALRRINAERSCGISALDPAWWEWMDSAGSVIPVNVLGMITGLQLIANKLST